jgi:hypothetical protein
MKEKAPVPTDENPDLKGGKQTTDEDNEPPTVPDRDGAINVGKPTAVGIGVAIVKHSPFAIDDTKTDERVDTMNVSNVDDGVNHHVSNGDASTIPDKGTDDEQVLDAVSPRKKPSRPIVPKPEVPTIFKRKSSPLCYVHFVFISIVSRRTIEMRMIFLPLCMLFSSQSSAGGRLR